MTQTYADLVKLMVSQIKAGCQAFHLVVGGQSGLAYTFLRDVAKSLSENRKKGEEYGVVDWYPKEGIACDPPKPATINPITAIDLVMSQEPVKDFKHFLFVCHDIAAMLDAPALFSHIKRLICTDFFNAERRRPLVLVTVSPKIHVDLVPYLKYHELAYPSETELKFEVDSIMNSASATKDASPEIRNHVVQAALGMGLQQAKDAVGTAVILNKDQSDLNNVADLVVTEKAKVLRATAGLEYVPARDVQAAKIGGYDLLKKWVNQRVAALRGPAAGILDRPKGIALYGVPGVGKSVAARVIAQILGIPLVRFDVGAIFGAYVGQSEGQLREALRAAEALKHCVFLIDELDKMLGGSQSSSSGDGGVGRRVLGTLLTWLAEKQSDVFVVATLNRVESVPSELLRRGRFDELFFVDLPHEHERAEIFNIHMQRRRMVLDDDTHLNEICDEASNHSGAEIEQAVIAAAYAAAETGRLLPRGNEFVLPYSYLHTAVEMMRPLSEIDEEGIRVIRDFGSKRMSPASSPMKSVKPTSGRKVDLTR